MNAEWMERRLDDLLWIKHGYAFPGAGFRDDPRCPTLVTPGNFRIGGGFQEAKMKTFEGDYPEEFRLNAGDVIVTMTDLSRNADTLGYAAVVPDDGRTYLHNQRIGKVILKSDEVDARFVSYLLRTDAYRAYVLGSASGSTVKHTSPGRIQSFSTRIPSLPEQQRIAAVLRALDDLADSNRLLALTIDDAARSVWRESLHRSSADSVRVGDVATVVLGGTPSRKVAKYWGGDIPWLNSGEANAFRVLRGSEGITREGYEHSSTKLMPAGTTVIAITGATLGQVTRLEIDACGNQSLVGVYGESQALTDHLYLAISEDIGQLVRHATGGAQQHVNKGNVEEMAIPSPSARWLKQVSEQVSPLLSCVGPLLVEADAMAATRDLLLPLLMSGSVQVSANPRAA